MTGGEFARTAAEVRELLDACRAHADDPRFSAAERAAFGAYVVALEWVLGITEDHIRAMYRRGRPWRQRRDR